MLRAVLLVFGSGLALGHAALAGGEAPADRLSGNARRAAEAVRDCTPINGRFGYYGNPWCDTGSYRLEDIEFRARARLAKRRR